MAKRYKGWDVVATRTLPSGEIIDYVAAESLYPEDPSAPFVEPPPEPQRLAAAGLAKSAAESEGFEKPEGTVPIARPNFSYFVDGKAGTDDLQKFLSAVKPTPNHSGNRLYARHRDNVTHIATAGSISSWDFMDVNWGDEMTLMQGSSACGSSSTLEAIEFGYQEFPAKYGDAKPHFFTFFRTAGGAMGHLIGGYNLDFNGFIVASGATFTPGQAANTGTFSLIGGSQFHCHFEARLFQGNWWVYACNAWQGFYPGPNSGVASSLRIPFDLIDNDACWAQWYGEVADLTPNQWTNADMGSGRFAGAGWQQAAYIASIRHVTPAGALVDMQSDLPFAGNGGDDPNCYTSGNLFWGGSNWQTMFYLGGPGGNDPAGKCN